MITHSQEKARAERDKARQQSWAAMSPEMRADMKALAAVFGRFELTYLEVNGKVIKGEKRVNK